mgnify:CR=1 FL=1
MIGIEGLQVEREPAVADQRWRPGPGWWLFAMTVAEAGLPDDTQIGWRRALFLALSDGERPAAKRKRRPVQRDIFSLPLFD